MKPLNDRTQPGQLRPILSLAPRKRFRVEKLEERIAPGRVPWGHYNLKTKCVGGGACD